MGADAIRKRGGEVTKKEVAKELRKRLTEAIRSLPDVEYQCVSVFKDRTTQYERDHDGHTQFGDSEDGALHMIELTIEEERQ